MFRDIKKGNQNTILVHSGPQSYKEIRLTRIAW